MAERKGRETEEAVEWIDDSREGVVTRRLEPRPGSLLERRLLAEQTVAAYAANGSPTAVETAQAVRALCVLRGA